MFYRKLRGSSVHQGLFNPPSRVNTCAILRLITWRLNCAHRSGQQGQKGKSMSHAYSLLQHIIQDNITIN